MKWKLYAEHVDRGRTREFVLYREEEGELFAVEPLVTKKVDEGYIIHPFAFCDGRLGGNAVPDELMAIFNGLWGMGIRPTAFEDRTRETGAIRDHLEDMRRLVLKEKFVELKGM